MGERDKHNIRKSSLNFCTKLHETYGKECQDSASNKYQDSNNRNLINVSSLLFLEIWPLNELEALSDKVKERGSPCSLCSFV